MRIPLCATIVVACSTLLVHPVHAQYVVTSTADAGDTAPGDGTCLSTVGGCTVRAAIQEANAAPGLNSITLPGGVFKLTIPGTNEDSALTGDLDVTQDLIIDGVRSASSIIDGGGLDRVIDQRAGQLQLRRVTVRNGAADHGGGIRSAVPLLLLEDSVVRDNTASGSGGGIFASYPAQIVRSTIALNRAGTQGGGIYAGITTPNGVHDISNSTISGNVAGGSGGGIAIATTGGSGSGAILLHTTLHLNGAPAGASILADGGASAVLRNSVVSATGSNCAGNVVTEGGSLAATPCGNVPVVPSLFDSFELLGLYHPPLIPGPVLGHGPVPTSPVIDAAVPGFCPAIDQRGVSRAEGGSTCDSGAFEFSAAHGPYNATPVSLTLSPISNQAIQPGTSTQAATVVVANNGAPIEQIVLTGASFNHAVVPPSGIRITRVADGIWTVRVFPRANATGVAGIRITAVTFGPDDMATQTFAVDVRGADGGAGGGSPAAAIGLPPGALSVTPSGAGTVLTWSASSAPGARQYAVVGGRSAGGTSLPVLLTSGRETSMTLPALPAGSYAFRVHAIGTHGLTAASSEVTASLGSAQAPGPPYAVVGTALEQAVEITGRAPAFGAPASAYRVEFGTTPGASDVAAIMPTAAPFQHAVPNGFYWLQARAIGGALLGVPSSTFGVRVGGVAGCNEPPHAPILLPASVTGGTATLTWVLPDIGPPAQRFVVERLSGAGDPPIETISLSAQATIYVADLPPGTHYFRVAGRNACGVGQFSTLNAVLIGGAH